MSSDEKSPSTGVIPCPSPWLTVGEAAERARVGVKLIYREVAAGRLRAARVGGRRDLRLRPEWIDAWLDATAIPVEVFSDRPSGHQPDEHLPRRDRPGRRSGDGAVRRAQSGETGCRGGEAD
jgi:excisionase family DNA binding protein